MRSYPSLSHDAKRRGGGLANGARLLPNCPIVRFRSRAECRLLHWFGMKSKIPDWERTTNLLINGARVSVTLSIVGRLRKEERSALAHAILQRIQPIVGTAQSQDGLDATARIHHLGDESWRH